MDEHRFLPASLFDDFVADRPDEERWELIERSFVMQEFPSLDHQIICTNVATLLGEALDRVCAKRIALHRLMIDLTPVSPGNKFVPDVVVIDTDDIEPDRYSTARCYLAAEIVAAEDRTPIIPEGRTRLEIKREGYAALPDCEVILFVEQDCFAARIGLRDSGEWTWARLSDPTDEVMLPTFGLGCRLSDFYAMTSLSPGRTRRPTIRH